MAVGERFTNQNRNDSRNIEIVATTSEISEICPGVVIFSTFLLFDEFSEITSENFELVWTISEVVVINS